MSTIFTKIINREIPGFIVAEDDAFIAFLDISPIVKGHTLVVPKKEVDKIFDLDDNTLSGLHLFAKRVAKALEQVISCNRVGVAIVGLEVPHAHVHLFPINRESDMNFSNPRLDFSKNELVQLTEKISVAFSSGKG